MMQKEEQSVPLSEELRPHLLEDSSFRDEKERHVPTFQSFRLKVYLSIQSWNESSVWRKILMSLSITISQDI